MRPEIRVRDTVGAFALPLQEWLLHREAGLKHREAGLWTYSFINRSRTLMNIFSIKPMSSSDLFQFSSHFSHKIDIIHLNIHLKIHLNQNPTFQQVGDLVVCMFDTMGPRGALAEPGTLFCEQKTNSTQELNLNDCFCLFVCFIATHFSYSILFQLVS